MQSPARQLQKRRFLIWGVLLTVAVLLRITGLGIWPEIQADEGLWTIGTKNFVLFGDWFLDGRTHLFLSPVFHFLTLIPFEVAGPGLVEARLISGLAGVGMVAVIGITVHRLKSNTVLTTLTLLIAAVTQYSVLMSRTALIEPVQLLWLSLVVLALTFDPNRKRALALISLLALALLTKLNSGIIVVVALVMLTRKAYLNNDHGLRSIRSLLPVAAGVALAAGFYALLYLWRPQQFISAFTFELDGVHFEAISQPLVRLGRFAIDPGKMAETVLGLFREMPFVMVLGVLGFADRLTERFQDDEVLAVWLIMGAGFTLIQMYQPMRYMYLVFPPLTYFAAVGLSNFLGTNYSAESGAELRSLWSGRSAIIVSTFVLFQIGYLGGNVFTNRGEKLAAIHEVSENLPSESTVVGASYLCVDMSQKCLSHYNIVNSNTVVKDLKRSGAGFVMVDRAEWGKEMRSTVARSFKEVVSFDFGTVYRVADPTRLELGPNGFGQP